MSWQYIHAKIHTMHDSFLFGNLVFSQHMCSSDGNWEPPWLHISGGALLKNRQALCPVLLCQLLTSAPISVNTLCSKHLALHPLILFSYGCNFTDAKRLLPRFHKQKLGDQIAQSINGITYLTIVEMQHIMLIWFSVWNYLISVIKHLSRF